jgi:hypothetical protein
MIVRIAIASEPSISTLAGICGKRFFAVLKMTDTERRPFRHSERRLPE